MRKSDSVAELAKALAKFNGEMERIAKDSNNPHHKSKYASLDQIIDITRPILQKNGLSIMQVPSGDGDNVTITTMLLHESGEWIESDPFTMKPVKAQKGGGTQFSNDPQTVGSVVTYARRYSLAAFLSLNTGEDDDGNAASGRGQASNQPQPAQPAQGLNAEQVKQINTLANELAQIAGTTPNGVLESIAKQVGAFQSVAAMKLEQGQKAYALLTQWIAERKGGN